MYSRTAGLWFGRRAGARRVEKQEATAAGAENKGFWRNATRATRFCFYSQRINQAKTGRSPFQKHSPWQTLLLTVNEGSHGHSSAYPRRPYTNPAVPAFVATCGTISAQWMLDEERRERALLNARIVAEQLGWLETEGRPTRAAVTEVKGPLAGQKGMKMEESWAELAGMRLEAEVQEFTPWMALVTGRVKHAVPGNIQPRWTDLAASDAAAEGTVSRRSSRNVSIREKYGLELLRPFYSQASSKMQPTSLPELALSGVQSATKPSAATVHMKPEITSQIPEPVKKKPHKKVTKRDSAIDLTGDEIPPPTKKPSLTEDLSDHEARLAVTLGLRNLKSPKVNHSTSSRLPPVTLFQSAAERGHAGGAYNAALCFDRGIGGAERDVVRALVLYRQAAYAGHADAMFNLGVLLMGRGVEEGVEWVRKAAEEGCVEAREALESVDSVLGGEARLEDWMRDAENGSGLAAYNVGVIFEGMGDVKKAVKWYEVAVGSERQDVKRDACFNLAVLCLETDPEKARTYLTTCSEMGDAEACEMLNSLE
ncbi:hypothetical protein HDV00_005791 [Rhizophlyctis rosea]|nr:hypothetical protein HDV00_005791 [Rhizophlyctis rosea]